MHNKTLGGALLIKKKTATKTARKSCVVFFEDWKHCKTSVAHNKRHRSTHRQSPSMSASSSCRVLIYRLFKADLGPCDLRPRTWIYQAPTSLWLRVQSRTLQVPLLGACLFDMSKCHFYPCGTNFL